MTASRSPRTDPHAARRSQSARRKKASVYLGELEVDEERLVPLIEELRRTEKLDDRAFDRINRRHSRGRGSFSKSDIILAFRHLASRFGWREEEATFVERIRMKPVRTGSGVAPVTVLTRPHPCPGRCVFCPSDAQMPKSYLAMEPGAQRATLNAFCPYRQTWTRLLAFHRNGHPLDKIELIVLGGTWSSYPEPYQVWFLKRCFDAMNDFRAGRIEGEAPAPEGIDFLDLEERIDGRGHDRRYNEVVSDYLRARSDEGGFASETAGWEELFHAQRHNETAETRCVGLSLETRPDCVTQNEVVRLRRLGATKVQLGIQSVDDRVLDVNQRGHDVATSRRAMSRLRAAGFKLHAHWMPNLLGATPAADRTDFQRLFDDPELRPDELKIYPCSLIESAELMRHFDAGEWRPYEESELVELLADCMRATPRTCRVTRVIRDIPSHDIVVGSRRSNLREEAERLLTRRGERSVDIRARQIRRRIEESELVVIDELEYEASGGRELFLDARTEQDELLGFLRLRLPGSPAPLEELGTSAVIREVHVYGDVARLGAGAEGRAQHGGLGRRLIARAEELARERGHERIAVISAIGTREYYRRLGFRDGELYQSKELTGCESPPGDRGP